MEAFIGFTLFGSVIPFIGVIIGLIIILFTADANENGWLATTTFIIVVLGNYFWGTFNILDYISWIHIGCYIGTGFLYAVLRTYFKGKELTKSYESREYKYENDSLARYKKEFKLKEHVFRWWFMFPVCLISWILSDLVKDLWNWIYAHTGQMFEKILNL